MRELTERAYFLFCLGVGRLLRAGRYSRVRIVHQDGETHVRKHRAFYAPFLVWLGDPVVRVLDTGMRVLTQHEWWERERVLYESLYGASIKIEADGTLVLPRLPGTTLAALLEDPALGAHARAKALDLTTVALVNLHARGFTHGDAMAENVLVDLEAGVARWFDFETVHDASRPLAWRRADDLRALLATSLLRTAPEAFAETLERILDVYSDEAIIPLLATSFASLLRRPLAFHLGQAGLSFRAFREVGRLLLRRCGQRSLGLLPDVMTQRQ